MNTICQDRDITHSALHFSRISTQTHSRAITRNALAMVLINPILLSQTLKTTQEQVGKNRGVSWQNFANWIQLANGCQLNSQKDQQLNDFSIQLAVGSWQILPTELSHCFHSNSTSSEVGEISPSYYV
jgi:hypothetical protein